MQGAWPTLSLVDLFSLTQNQIGDTGAVGLGEGLQTNMALEELRYASIAVTMVYT